MRILISLAISFFAISASSQTPPSVNQSTPVPRRAWEWSVDERLTDRLHIEKIQERTAAYTATLSPSQRRSISTAANSTQDAAPGSPPVITYYIDGHRNPELFLTYELFDMLLGGLASDASLRANERALDGPSIRGLGYDEAAFWASLESVSSGYLAVKDTVSVTVKGGDAHCAARYEALQAARRLFGRQQFDRLLYVVVAPNVVHSTSTMDGNHRDTLRRAELGCQ